MMIWVTADVDGNKYSLDDIGVKFGLTRSIVLGIIRTDLQEIISSQFNMKLKITPQIEQDINKALNDDAKIRIRKETLKNIKREILIKQSDSIDVILESLVKTIFMQVSQRADYKTALTIAFSLIEIDGKKIDVSAISRFIDIPEEKISKIKNDFFEKYYELLINTVAQVIKNIEKTPCPTKKLKEDLKNG